MASAKANKKAGPPADKVECYDRLVASRPEIPRKGDTVPYTSVNGNMFSYLHASGAMALRLSKEDREAFLERYETRLFEAYGIVQKEYVMVPDALLHDTPALLPYFDLSFKYASGLKPKPSKKG